MSQIYSLKPQNGQTRLCIEPWAKAFIRANGDVHLCCYHTPVGSINDKPLCEVLNSEEAKSYRLGLLTGDLKPACQACGDKKLVSQEELKQAVEEWYKIRKMYIT